MLGEISRMTHLTVELGLEPSQTDLSFVIVLVFLNGEE